MPPKPLPVWTDAELEAARAASRATFRKERVDEPVEVYSEQYEQAMATIGEVLELTADLRDLRTNMPAIVHHAHLRRALRYMTGPPISDDDLMLLADAKLSRRFALDNPEAVDQITDTFELLLDGKRFPWVGEARVATAAERHVAVLATAAMDATERVRTIRRNRARGLETEVKAALTDAGYREVPKRSIATAGDWPAPGQFCGECQVAGRQADLAVTLHDSRYLPIEAKVSASELNSIKRLNNDSVAKFAVWTGHFGRGQTVPVAVLEGAFALERLQVAQAAGAGIFWRHDLAELAAFVQP